MKAKTIGRLVVLSLLVLLSFHLRGKAESRICAVFQAKDGQSYQANVQEYGGSRYLLLPSFCDVRRMNVNGLNGLIYSKSGAVSCSDDKPVNLKKVIPSFAPGTLYPVTFATPEGNMEVGIMQTEKMPTVFIDLGVKSNGGKTSRHWLDADKSNHVFHSSLRMVSADGKSSETTLVEKIKCRGSASFDWAEKKSYAIKLESSCELIKGAGSSKKWALVANDVYDQNMLHDRSGLLNFSSRWMYKALKGKYAVDMRFVDLYMNGEYRGLYMLTEKIEVSKTRISLTKAKMKYEDKSAVTRVVGSCGLFLNGETVWDGYDTANHRDRMDTNCSRITTVQYHTAAEDRADPAIRQGIRAYQYATNSKVQKQGGYLLEIDITFSDVTAWFVTRRGAAIALKEPEYASREQVQRIAAYVQRFEDALYAQSGFNSEGRRFTAYADMNSAVRYTITEFFLANIDTFRTSTFLSVDLIKGKLQPIRFGPVWDNDYCKIDSTHMISGKLAFKLKSKGSGYPMFPWIEQLFTKSEYVSLMNKVWKKELMSATGKLASSVLPKQIKTMESSLKMNALITNSFDPQAHVNRAFEGIKGRIKTWKGLWSSSHLKGVSVSCKDNRLIAKPDGPFTKIEWYKINGKNGSSKCVFSGKYASFAPKENGKYFAVATGPNILYNSTAKFGALTKETREMCSAVIDFRMKNR